MGIVLENIDIIFYGSIGLCVLALLTGIMMWQTDVRRKRQGTKNEMRFMEKRENGEYRLERRGSARIGRKRK